jgi:hypothetical protein
MGEGAEIACRRRNGEEKMAQIMVAFERHRPLWTGSLIFFSAVLSLGFSCAAPLAAFAAIGAVTLRRRDALLVIAAVWLANQFIGFAALHYPLERGALAWGGVLGAAAIGATLAARWGISRYSQRNRFIRAGAAFMAAFAAYEGILFAISAMSATGIADFAPVIVLRIFLINATAFASLSLLRRAMALGRPPLGAQNENTLCAYPENFDAG